MNLTFKVFVISFAMLLGGLFFTAIATFDKVHGVVWQQRAVGPVMLLSSPVLFWLACRSLKHEAGENDNDTVGE